MPVAKITEEMPRKPTAFDIQNRRGPNDGTEWAGSEPNPNKLIDTGEIGNPSRFTQWNDGTVKGIPKQRPVDEVLAERGWDCKVCGLNFKTMETFNAHCVPSKHPEALPKEMPCEMAKRLFAEKNAQEKAHMMDPNSVAIAVAEALKPTLLSIVGAFEKVNDSLIAISRGEKIKAPKKERKQRGRPRVVRGAAPAGGAEPPGSVGPTSEPLANPPAEPPPAE